MYCTTDVSSSSNEEEEPPRNTPIHFSKNGKTWTPLQSARSVRTNPSHIVRVKPGVNPALLHKAAASSYECWKLFIDNTMLKTIQAQTTRDAKKRNSDFELSLEKLEAFKGLQYIRGIHGKRHPVEFLLNKEFYKNIFVAQWLAMFCKAMA